VTRYVIDPGTALVLAEKRATIPAHHQLLAPTLLRSQVLSQLFADVKRGVLTQKEANQRLDYLRGLQMRLLGDRMLQRVAWKIADELGWADTFAAEYLALTQLQADALVACDARLLKTAGKVVPLATMEELLS
jgi:predicted nucleic acid-binding protein